jgi:hypothetical protein
LVQQCSQERFRRRALPETRLATGHLKEGEFSASQDSSESSKARATQLRAANNFAQMQETTAPPERRSRGPLGRRLGAARAVLELTRRKASRFRGLNWIARVLDGREHDGMLDRVGGPLTR